MGPVSDHHPCMTSIFELNQLLAYVAVAAVLIAVPGPNTALILAHSLAGGRRAGLATVVGVELGTLLHTVAAACGVSAAVARSALAFDVVKLVGAAVLVVLGLRELLGRAKSPGEALTGEPAQLGTGRALTRAFIGNVLNPKVAIFFLAFLPQWVDPARGSVLVQFLVLGGILSLLGLLTGAVLALAAAAAASRLTRHAGFWRWQRRLAGGVLIALGAHLARIEAT